MCCSHVVHCCSMRQKITERVSLKTHWAMGEQMKN